MANIGTGKGGKSLQDRELAARVRTLALQEIEKALKNKKNKRFYEAVLIRIASTVLPRINEHSGPDGKPIPLYDYTVRNNHRHKEDTGTESED